MAASIPLKTALLTALVLLLPACSEPIGFSEEKALDRMADEVAIRDVLEESFAASSRLDAAGVAATYTIDGDAWITGQDLVSGREELRRLEEEFTSMVGFQGWQGTIESIRFISPDAAIVEITGITTLENRQLHEDTTIVVVRRGPVWKIAAWRVINFDGQSEFRDTQSENAGEPAL